MGKFKVSVMCVKFIDCVEGFLMCNGIVVVFLLCMVFSLLGFYIIYISGVIGLSWVKFIGVVMIGVVIWFSVYVYFGYVFVGNIS